MTLKGNMSHFVNEKLASLVWQDWIRWKARPFPKPEFLSY
jgi:hypothetical protein